MNEAADALAVADAAKGFLPADEADALRAAAAAAPTGTWLEIGTYCGKSTVHLASVARESGAALITVDHHHGSEENQPGWQWHDAAMVDPHTGRLDTLPTLRHTLSDAGLEDVVTVVVGNTAQVSSWWSTPVTFLFLDGNHTEETAQFDYAAFAPHVVRGGVLAIHDVFPDPADGGQAPWHVFERATGDGAFEEISRTGSLRVLRRTDAHIASVTVGT